MSHQDQPDIDPVETQEWVAAIKSVLQHSGQARSRFLVEQVIAEIAREGASLPRVSTPYINTIPAALEAPIGEDEAIATRLRDWIRWNAIIMVLHATSYKPELGGHLASYASIAILYEVGFNHFFRTHKDLVYFQGHSSPGIYARSYLAGQLTQSDIELFRREIDGGISSYPHPWLMPDYWQFPTVSMGLGPIQAIYQARFMKYLHNRGLIDAADRKVWCFLGDGETDEPESTGALTVAPREGLDNLIFVINCNLQRLDGPVRGNGKIIQELESLFLGAGWHVIKVIWGSGWDHLLAKDKSGLLIKRMNEVVDGEYQTYKARDGAFVREHFFGAYPELAELVADMTDDEIWRLTRGGLDPAKVFAAYSAAQKHQGQPVVILAKTIKGYGMGAAGEALNITHQQKKMTTEQLLKFRDRFNLPLSDEQVEQRAFIQPDPDSPEIRFLHARREALGGAFPQRRAGTDEQLEIPALSAFDAVLDGSGDREISTTMAFVRILNILLKDQSLGQRIVPIVPDESRTFGMEGLFRQIGIYAPKGQLYTPVDADQVMSYKESTSGQILQEGINEGGAFCSWIAAATAYSNHNLTMVPFYIYYSMFGFQRIGDFAWAAGDMQARGFLIGATAGRTTLAGEGLQHQDGHSLIFADTIPNCVSYDPCFAYELAVIIHEGLRRMVAEQENVFYYITAMNENYQQPAMPDGVEEGILKGIYLLSDQGEAAQVQLLGSGTILREAIKAADILANDYQITANIWSVTSFNELYREAWGIERENRQHPDAPPIVPYITQVLTGHRGPVIAVTDYIRAQVERVRGYVPAPYVTLGTDGFGRSDTRDKLRYFFEVDANYIAYAAIVSLVQAGELAVDVALAARRQLGIDEDKPNPLMV